MRTTLSDWKIGPTACSMYCLVIRHPHFACRAAEVRICALQQLCRQSHVARGSVPTAGSHIEHGGRGLTIMIFDYIAISSLRSHCARRELGSERTGSDTGYKAAGRNTEYSTTQGMVHRTGKPIVHSDKLWRGSQMRTHLSVHPSVSA